MNGPATSRLTTEPPAATPAPRALFETIGDTVHAGFFRTAPGVEPSDFCQAAIRPGGVRPGTMHDDPNGRVLVAYEVHRDGEVLTFDGHPASRRPV